MRTQQERSHLRARKRALVRTQLAGPLISVFQSPELNKNEFLFFFFFLSFFFFFAFWGCTCGIWRFPGRGANQSRSCPPVPPPPRPRIQATSATYTVAQSNTTSLATWVRPEIEPAASWFLVGFVSTVPQQELQERNEFLLLRCHPFCGTLW